MNVETKGASATAHRESGPRILRMPSVCEKIGLSAPTVYRMVAAGAFPAPVRIGARATGWVSEQVDAWIEERIAQGNKARAKPAPAEASA